ncbi:MAG: hypothetical protein FWG87_12515 [Defluviitaleaceae bacterium]|nr:hypothetical protein [Defluviitaleaceae bacterium]
MVREDNRAVRVLADMGRRQGLEQAVVNMLREDMDISKISRLTGIEISRITELQSELYAQNA